MNQSLTAAVVGTGFIGPVHVEALRRAGVHVAGIAGSSPEKGVAAATELGLGRGYSDLAEILADDRVDVVHLTTPNYLHFSQASAVLRSGKHLLCEKPLAITSVESAELVRLARSSNCCAGVAYNIRFYPLANEARSRVQSPQFGNLFHIHGSYTQDWLLRQTDFNWRVDAQAAGALRAIADIGTHWLDLVQYISGRKVTSVCADLQTVHRHRHRPNGHGETFSEKPTESGEMDTVAVTTEDAGAVLLKFEDGSKGSLHVSQTMAGRKNCLEFDIAGEKESLSWNSETPNQLWVGHRDRPNESLLRDPALLSKSAAATANYPGGHNEGFPDTFKQLFRAFYGHILAGDRSGPAPYPTFEDGHWEVLLGEAILKSHLQQAWVDVAEPDAVDRR